MGEWKLTVAMGLPNPNWMFFTIDQVIENPTWEQIYSFLLQLNGRHIRRLTLDNPNHSAIYVMGGDPDPLDVSDIERIEPLRTRLYYVLFYDFEEDQFYQLTTPSADPNQLISLAVGEFYANYLVEFPDVVASFRYFFLTGERSKDLPWE
jgi:hypothetical protein